MKPNRIIQTVIVAGALLAAAAITARADDESSTTIKFSDPSKPGTLRIELMIADIKVTGADTNEVTVLADSPVDNGKPRKDGLRSIGGGSGYRVTEKDNVITIDAGGAMGMMNGGPADFDITVPRNTNIVLKVVHGGDTVVDGVSGDIEISNQNGDVHLKDISGGVAADTLNGEIVAQFAKLPEGKTYSFASMNGEISLRVPPTAKANVRFRAQLGEVLTDFSDKELVTHLGPTVTVETPEAPEAVPAPTPDPAIAGVHAPKAPKSHEFPPFPKIPSFPAFGGQVVTGTLNGGGPELIATTMRGTITLRKSD